MSTVKQHPMKLTDVGFDAAEHYITDPQWVMQQKFDGARVMIHATRERIVDGSGGVEDWSFFVTNDGVKEISFSAAKLKVPALLDDLRALLAGTTYTYVILDGELIIEDGVYWVFDLVQGTTFASHMVLPDHRWEGRHEYLKHLFGNRPDGSLARLSPTAYDAAAKRELWERIVAAGVEGAISKHIDSPWVAGIRTKDWVKHKLVKTADVVVTAIDNWTSTTGSAALGIPIDPSQDPEPVVDGKGKRLSIEDFHALDDKTAARRAPFSEERRTMLQVGNASLIGKDRRIQVGSVVEVNYLYWTGVALIQPRIIKLRNDKLADECDMSQLPVYSREAVTL